MLQIDSEPVGKGFEREAYVHPEDHNKIIKISINKDDLTRQHDRELRVFSRLNKRKNMCWDHLPRFYGEVQTNLGPGLSFELIRDYDGQISGSLESYIERDGLDTYLDKIRDLKQYFFNYNIVFNYDLKPDNLLLRKTSPSDSQLVLIDGVGDYVFLSFLNVFRSHREAKLHRRWRRFENKWLGGVSV